ncbi:hypothetical protein [uncultured Sunxiuqinia sp.]|uniref:hypothetical protein n=1 Tax=Sunxiuqinia rutila TaxID=1397841 RepID=UPI00260884CB|nr:hypothetical protein [uncultured Sunxiuqinia sp.]
MKKNFTLVYFIHDFAIDRCGPQEIETNDLMGENEHQQGKERSFTPSEKSVEAILNFSRSYDVLNSRLTASIELIKN